MEYELRPKLDFVQFLPLGILASAGVGVQYVNAIFNSNFRWLILITIFLGLVLKGKFNYALKGRTAKLVIAFTLYAIFTTAWSEIPLLSGSKSILHFFNSTSYFALAIFWVQKRGMNEALNFLWSILGLAIVASSAGVAINGSSINMNADISLYRGLSYNSNFLGILLMLSLPLPLWHCTRNDVQKWSRRIAIVVVLFIGIMLLKTVSRSSILSSSIIILFFFWGRGVNTTMAIFLLVALFAILSILAFPQLIDELVFKFVQKGNQAETLLYSREGLYGASLEGANAGGVFGLGFGVSFGFFDYQIGQGSAFYGREKGNATLAIIEEMGMFGVLLFIAFLLSVFSSIISAILVARSQEERTILFLLLGVILGLLTHSQFEAWLLSPGASATPVFWAFVGISCELARRIKNDSLAEKRKSFILSKPREFPKCR